MKLLLFSVRDGSGILLRSIDRGSLGQKIQRTARPGQYKVPHTMVVLYIGRDTPQKQKTVFFVENGFLIWCRSVKTCRPASKLINCYISI
jgi:hypothetical protein